MVKIIYYGETQSLDQIPENFIDFMQLAGSLFLIEDVDKYVFEYTHDNKNFKILNLESYNDLFLGGNTDTTVLIFMSLEETNYFNNKKEEDKQKNELDEKKIESDEKKIESDEKKIESDEIKTDEKENENKNENEDGNVVEEDGGIKVPPITKEMVINSIVQQVRERMQQSRIMMQQKEKEEREKEEKERIEREKKEKERKEKEKEEEKGVSNQINNLISNRLDNLKEELINESQIKFSQIISESQLNLNKIYEENCINDNHENKKEIIQSLEKHPGFSCSKCGVNPIIGNRYCCVYCNNVNYCEKCEEENGLIHGHPLYKFKLRIA